MFLKRRKQSCHCVEVTALFVLSGVAACGSGDDDWRIIVISAEGVDESKLEYLPSEFVEGGDEFVLVPFVIELDLLRHLREVKLSRVVEAQE